MALARWFLEGLCWSLAQFFLVGPSAVSCWSSKIRCTEKFGHVFWWLCNINLPALLCRFAFSTTTSKKRRDIGRTMTYWWTRHHSKGIRRLEGPVKSVAFEKIFSWTSQLLSSQHPENLQSRGRRGGEANGARIRSTWLRRLAMLWWFCVMDFGKTHRTAGKNGAKRLKFRCQGWKGGRWSFPPVRSRPWTFWRRRGGSSAWAAGSWRWRSSLCDKTMS